MTSKNYGPGASGYLDPSQRNWETTVYQAAKPILDKELNFIQDVSQDAALTLQRRSFPSGWVSDDFLNNVDSGLFIGEYLVNNMALVPPLWAHVNGWLFPVTNTGINDGNNVIDLGVCPAGVGSKSNDLVILEVWRRLIPAGPSTTGKSPTGRIWLNGNVKIASADDLTLNPPDDILDGAVGSETTKRVQIQYRLRTINTIDLFTYNFGMNAPTVIANTVPASPAAPDGVPSTEAFTYVNQSFNGDPGLWIAGDGNPANSLGTVDGFMYAIPLMAVFRRNTSPFDRNTNQNGGVAYPGTSDRPDNFWCDIIEARDILDLRNGVAPTGWDINEVLQKNTNFLFDNVNQTEIGETTIGGGTDGHTVMWADEIGVSNANGGDGVITGDTPGAEFIGEFDAVRRVFSDRATYETIVLKFLPNSVGVSPGGATWTVGTTITISPSALPIFPYAAFNWSSFAPSEVSIQDVVRTVFAGDTAGQISFNASANFQIQGLGGVPQGSITLTIRSLTDGTNTATNEPLFVTLLVAYPPGVGLSKTGTNSFADNPNIPTQNGIYINNPAQLPASAPILFNGLGWNFNFPNREVRLEYVTVAHDYSYRPGTDALNYVFYVPERPIDGSVSVTVNGSPYVGSITVDQYTITLDPVFVGGENVVFNYSTSRALPQNDEQLTIYYEARLPQTIREFLLPVSLDLTSKYVAQHMFVLTAGSGAENPAYPFPSGYVQTGGVYPSSGGTFSGDHELDGDLRVSITTLYTDTGFMQLPVNVPVVPSPNGVSFGRTPGDADIEGRTYYKTASGYGFLAVGSALSDPKKHKNVLPMLCEIPSDNLFGFKGQFVLVLLSRWSEFDDSNKVGFVADLAQNFTTASVYRLKGNLLNNRRV